MKNGASVKMMRSIFVSEKFIETSEIALPGKHNLENILAAISAVKLKGTYNEVIQEVLTSFHGVEHRLQYVATV